MKRPCGPFAACFFRAFPAGRGARKLSVYPGTCPEFRPAAGHLGYTLVELLVTTAIFATLFGLLSVGNAPSRRAQIRRAAQSLASVLTVTQSRALGRDVGAALILEPDPSSGALATVAFYADMLPHITARVTGIPPASPGSLTASGTITPTNADTADLQHGYKIRFFEQDTATQPPSAWLQFTPPSAATSNVATVSLRGTSGQSLANTIWPKPVSPPFDAAIARYPAKATFAMQCAKAAAIDLRYSGFGDDPTTPYGSLAGKGAIAIAYDRLGGVDAVMQQVLSTATARMHQPIDPITPVYFFVAARDEILDPAANTLASDEAIWVAIHPQTGRVHVSANVPQSATNAAAIYAARAKARAGLPLGK
jgi:prepilin-type N-terminal cleavage/methylation domain-containing protein